MYEWTFDNLTVDEASVRLLGESSVHLLPRGAQGTHIVCKDKGFISKMQMFPAQFPQSSFACPRSEVSRIQHLCLPALFPVHLLARGTQNRFRKTISLLFLSVSQSIFAI